MKAPLAGRSGGTVTLTDRIRRGGKAVLGAFAGLSVLAILFLSFEIVDELRFLSSANSDNVHWTLSQAEVEFLEFQNAVDRARMADDPLPNRNFWAHVYSRC